MDIQPTNQQPISDDQELAKVLAGITAGADSAAADLAADLTDDAASTTTAAPALDMADDAIAPTVAPVPTTEPVFSAPAMTTADSGLEAIKNDALNELRPLVDKLNLSPEEKFDTYLLIIRSTDDTTLLSPAFEAARAITDETIKAQALLDVVKEIDYLSNPQKQAA